MIRSKKNERSLTTAARAYTYNHLGQLLTVTDDAGTRTLSYNTYGELAADSLLADGKTHLITEASDGYGRSVGYTYAKDGAVQQTVFTGYGTDGRIATAGLVHGGAQKAFSYAYLPGSNLLQTLTKPNNMTLTLSYEPQRDLLTGMSYKRGATSVVSRSYTYDTLGRPTSRSTSKDGATVNDSFGYNTRSELTAATVNNGAYAYDYDNIGNRAAAVEDSSGVASRTEYTANALNQYTAIGDFEPTYDDAGNQTTVRTETGVWSVIYNAENRPVSFTNAESATVIECTYDYMGRRATKKVTVNGTVTLHHRYLYRGYLQVACCDLTRSAHPCLWLICWDPSQPVATRPLAIQKDGTWYTYGWDLTKNICEVFGQHGYIRTNYTYTPYGQVTSAGDVTQPIQWSSEYHDTELALVYYNYRHYNPQDGRWLRRDLIDGINLYAYVWNNVYIQVDYIGLWVNPKGDKIEWCAQKGDSLATLPRRANPKATFKDWECMWPVEGTSDHGYPRLIRPGDVYDASNVLTTHINELYIEMDSDLLPGHRANYGAQATWLVKETSNSAFLAIKEKSGEGKYPISYMVLGGHGGGKGEKRGVTKRGSEDVFDAFKIPDYAPYEWIGSDPGLRQPYDFASKQNRRGPHRCWFTKNSKVIFPGCSTMILAEKFANLVLRKGAKVQGTRIPVQHSRGGYRYKGYPIKKEYTEPSIYYSVFNVTIVEYEDAVNSPLYAIYEGKL